MRKINILGSILFLSLLFASCSSDDTKVVGKYDKGVFIVNEGNFQSSDGSITYYNTTSGEVSQDIFGTSNNGNALGDVVQSMTIDNNLAYIIINNDNKIKVVNVGDFTLYYTLSNVKLPRYFIVYNDKGYLTEWVSFVDPGRVSVVNLASHQIEATITTDYGAENIIGKDGMLYVSNNFTNTVSVIDPTKNEVVKTIEVGSSPGAFVVGKDDKLWVICGGGYDEEYNPLNDGALYQINTSTNEVDKTVSLNMNLTAKIAINKTKDKIYYYKGKKIYAFDVSSTESSAEALITEEDVIGFYGIGYDEEKDLIFAGDAKGFTGNGQVYCYDANGTRVKDFASGRGPNGFVFK
jgi:YVTN family beta-propeller protein